MASSREYTVLKDWLRILMHTFVDTWEYNIVNKWLASLHFLNRNAAKQNKIFSIFKLTQLL